MRKANIKFTKTSNDTLTKWLKGESDPLNVKELSERVNLTRQTLYRHISSLKEGKKDIEDLFTITEMRNLILYQNEVADAPKQKEIDKKKEIEKQMKAINSVRKSQGKEALTLDEFTQKNYE